MVIAHSHSQPLLSHHKDRDLLSRAQGSSGSSDGSPFAIGDSTPRIHSSCNDDTGRIPRRGSNVAADAYKRHHSTSDAAGYVSLKDVIGSMKAAGDPLVPRFRSHPRSRRRCWSPGPLEAPCRGGMRRFVRYYVAPCLALLARSFVGCITGH